MPGLVAGVAEVPGAAASGKTVEDPQVLRHQPPGKPVATLPRLTPRTALTPPPVVTSQLAYISHAMMLQRLLRNGKHDDSIVYVRPAIQGYGLLDYDKKDEIVQLGVEAARKKIRVCRVGLWCVVVTLHDGRGTRAWLAVSQEWRRHRERRSFIRSTGQLASTGNITQSVSMLHLHMRPASDEVRHASSRRRLLVLRASWLTCWRWLCAGVVPRTCGVVQGQCGCGCGRGGWCWRVEPPPWPEHVNAQPRRLRPRASLDLVLRALACQRPGRRALVVGATSPSPARAAVALAVVWQASNGRRGGRDRG